MCKILNSIGVHSGVHQLSSREVMKRTSHNCEYIHLLCNLPNCVRYKSIQQPLVRLRGGDTECIAKVLPPLALQNYMERDLFFNAYWVNTWKGQCSNIHWIDYDSYEWILNVGNEVIDSWFTLLQWTLYGYSWESQCPIVTLPLPCQGPNHWSIGLYTSLCTSRTLPYSFPTCIMLKCMTNEWSVQSLAIFKSKVKLERRQNTINLLIRRKY